MRAIKNSMILMLGVLVIWGCQAPDRRSTSTGDARSGASGRSGRKTRGVPHGQVPGATVRRTAFTAEDNPTTRAGRGEPSLDDFFRPATWILVDGREGEFAERDGNPQVQWVINGPVSSSPTFRVEAFTPLLGVPRDFACTLDSVATTDGSSIAYAISAVKGTFNLGQDYSLLRPGDGFVVRNRVTGDVVSEIPPLLPGTYVLAAGVKNLQTGREGLAITYFTVAEGGGD